MTNPRIVVEDNVTNVIVTAPGPQGNSAQIFYTHTQSTPSAVWNITHNLGGYPTAVVLDSGGTMCEGAFSYPSTNTMVITFSAAFSGVAHLV